MDHERLWRLRYTIARCSGMSIDRLNDWLTQLLRRIKSGISCLECYHHDWLIGCVIIEWMIYGFMVDIKNLCIQLMIDGLMHWMMEYRSSCLVKSSDSPLINAQLHWLVDIWSINTTDAEFVNDVSYDSTINMYKFEWLIGWLTIVVFCLTDWLIDCWSIERNWNISKIDGGYVDWLIHGGISINPSWDPPSINAHLHWLIDCINQHNWRINHWWGRSGPVIRLID